MKAKTTRFGDIDIDDGKLISIPEGILGFPDQKRFVLLEHDSEGTPFKWLQSVDSPALAFIVMDPNLLIPEYDVQLDSESTALLGAPVPEESFVMMSIVNVPRENPIAMTLNVRAPIVVNLNRRVGKQIILPNEDYQIRHRIFPDSPESSQPAG